MCCVLNNAARLLQTLAESIYKQEVSNSHQLHIRMAEKYNQGLLWPSLRPDLNPLEMLWWDLKKVVHKQKHKYAANLNGSLKKKSSDPDILNTIVVC